MWRDELIEPGPDLSKFELDHVSVSQLRTFLMCGYRWYFDNAAGEDRTNAPGWSARLRGTALDKAATAHFDLKREDHRGLPMAQFVDLAVETHREGEDMTNFEMAEAESRDRTAKIAREYRSFFGELFQPWADQAAQQKFKYQDDGLLLPVHGIIDLRTADKVIVDNKVKAKKNLPKAGELEADLQLTTYSMATGWTHVALAVITDERDPQAQYYETDRNPAQWAGIKERYNQMIRSIRAGILHPAPEKSWYCCDKWCSHWSYCPHGGAMDAPIPGMYE